MSTSKPGIQLVPPPPASVVTGSASSRDLADILQFRNQLVETRNSQLEHKQTAAQLYDKIRQACRDLSRRDNSVKEGMEILNLERQRLGYLRDELARRADMISRWEAKIRDAERQASGSSQPTYSQNVSDKDKEADRINALLLEMDQKRKIHAAIRPNIPEDVSVLVATPQSHKTTGSMLVQQHLPAVSIFKKSSPISLAVGEDVIYPAAERGVGDSPAVTIINPVVVTEEDTTPAAAPPRPYPTWTVEGVSEDAFVEEMRECLDFFWKEYSTEIGGEDHRLMTMPNLMRLCADANLGAPTQAVIEIYLRAAKLGSECLVERKYFLTVLQSVLAVSLGKEISSNSVQLTDLLFTEYMMPQMVRLTVQQKMSSKHHPLLEKRDLILHSRYSN